VCFSFSSVEWYQTATERSAIWGRKLEHKIRHTRKKIDQRTVLKKQVGSVTQQVDTIGKELKAQTFADDLQKFTKPKDFPVNVLCETYEHWRRRKVCLFRKFIHEYFKLIFNIRFAFFVQVDMLKSRTSETTDYRKFMRQGFSFFMTRKLQLQCSFREKAVTLWTTLTV
jgi:hypothetical protein